MTVVLLIAAIMSGAESHIGTLSFMVGSPGQVQIIRQNQTEWHDAKLYVKIYTKDKIRTGPEARCEIKLNDGAVVRIGEKTEYEFTQTSRTGKKTKVPKGRIWANLTQRKKNAGFEIKTPTAVCAVRGTIYRVDADSTTRCRVYDGAVDVGPASFGGQDTGVRQSKSLKPVQVPAPHEVPAPYEVSLEDWVKIVKGYQITVRADGKYAKSQFDRDTDARIDWVKWNLERDDRL